MRERGGRRWRERRGVVCGQLGTASTADPCNNGVRPLCYTAVRPYDGDLMPEGRFQPDPPRRERLHGVGLTSGPCHSCWSPPDWPGPTSRSSARRSTRGVLTARHPVRPAGDPLPQRTSASRRPSEHGARHRPLTRSSTSSTTATSTVVGESRRQPRGPPAPVDDILSGGAVAVALGGDHCVHPRPDGALSVVRRPAASRDPLRHARGHGPPARRVAARRAVLARRDRRHLDGHHRPDRPPRRLAIRARSSTGSRAGLPLATLGEITDAHRAGRRRCDRVHAQSGTARLPDHGRRHT